MTHQSLDTFRAQPLQTSWRWVRQNLLSSPFNVGLTCITLLLLGGLIWGLGHWLVDQAQWNVIAVNFRLFMAGRYPVAQLWRLWLLLALVSLMGGLTWGQFQISRSFHWMEGAMALVGVLLCIFGTRNASFLWLGAIALLVLATRRLGQVLVTQLPTFGPYLPLGWLLLVPIGLGLMGGGLGLTPVSTSLWNGLVLTLWVAVLGIALSFPLGVLLALGRRSPLPVIRWLSTGYIELIRGLPLIGLLFMAQVMFPLLLPPQVTVDPLARAIAALTLFSAAYLAENVRGGLQSIPNGQWEAAQALGLSMPLTLALVVLPQALKAATPAIVGQFIGLFKDTSLLSIVGLVELLGIARSIASQPDYLGQYAEIYLFVGSIYWLFCYCMSIFSRRLEHSLGTTA